MIVIVLSSMLFTLLMFLLCFLWEQQMQTERCQAHEMRSFVEQMSRISQSLMADSSKVAATKELCSAWLMTHGEKHE